MSPLRQRPPRRDPIEGDEQEATVGPEQSGAHGEVPARVPTDELFELEEPDQDVV